MSAPGLQFTAFGHDQTLAARFWLPKSGHQQNCSMLLPLGPASKR